MPRTHDREAFFKLATKDVARIMIERRTLRWRTPLQFNDPFDTQTRFSAVIDPEIFADRMLERLKELAFAAEIPPFFDPESALHQQAMIARRNTPVADRPRALEVLRMGALGSARLIEETLGSFSDQITSHMHHGRTFCMTEEINNVVMWSHYAEEHSGVGFKFRVLDEADHPFLLARKVSYSDDYLIVGDSETLADHFSRAKPINLADLAWDLVYLKHSDWQYEREWRCYYPMLDRPAEAGYTDIPQPPELFEAIFLGCKMLESDRAQITELARQFLPQTEVYQAKKSRRSFDLEFERIV